MLFLLPKHSSSSFLIIKSSKNMFFQSMEFLQMKIVSRFFFSNAK